MIQVGIYSLEFEENLTVAKRHTWQSRSGHSLNPGSRYEIVKINIRMIVTGTRNGDVVS